MQNADMDGDPYKEDEKGEDEAYDLGEWVEDADGNSIRVSSAEADMMRKMGGANNGVGFY